MTKTISHIKEDILISHLTQDLVTMPEVIVGVGDDCAVLERDETHYTLLKTDTVVENVHFTDDAEPERVGWKAAARVVSDFASMGGTPESLLITIILPPETSLEWISKAYDGIKAVANNYRCSIVGGETSSTSKGAPKIISVSGTGTVPIQNLTLRSGGKPGDLIYVTGKLGGSIRGKHLDFNPRVKQGVWLARHAKPTAMMDLSDGIAKDLPRLTKLSDCGFEIFKSKIPTSYDCTADQALRDGEDYELLFTIAATKQKDLERNWEKAFPDLRLTHIGHLTEKPTDQPKLKLDGGWDHFGGDPSLLT